MDPKKIARYRSKLEDIKANLLGEVEKKRKSRQEGMNEQVADITDEAARTSTQQLMMDLGEQDWQKLKLVEEALERIPLGTYGICCECEEPIPEPRLNVLPFAKYCVGCLSEIEKESEDSSPSLG